MGDGGEIIILSSDDDDELDISCTESSVVIVEVEERKKNDVALPQSALDEDLVVTFCRRAEVLPHARYDCPIHAFTPTEWEIAAPVASNQMFCDQCFCYICDKLASLCAMWCHRGRCHCNGHKRSDFWNEIRDYALLRGLKDFNFKLSEVDAQLRQAEIMLQSFKEDLFDVFSSFVKGTTLEEYGLTLPDQQSVTHDYTPVYEFVSSFLNKADKQDTRAAAIMRVGAAEEFMRHFHFSGNVIVQFPTMNVAQAKAMLLKRVITSVQRQIVMGDFTVEFTRKIQAFYKKLCFPGDLKSMKNSLCVRPWNDVLLTSVLKGQNLSGIRKTKSKKDILIEQISVVLLRTELLQQQHRYRELYRYLGVIQTDDSKVWQQLQDLIPFFKCMDGDLMSAVYSLFPLVNAPATRLTPLLFLFYLRVFETATAPKLTVSHAAQLCLSDATWEPIKGAVPLKRSELVKFALRAQKLCSAVFADSQCWTRLLLIVNTPPGSLTVLPAPNPEFLHEARVVVNSLLRNLDGSNIQIPRVFQDVYPEQSLLLLVTGALCWRILSGPLSPALPVLNTFKENMWAVEWMWDSLGLRLKSFLEEILQEMKNAADSPMAVKLFPLVKAHLSHLLS